MQTRLSLTQNGLVIIGLSVLLQLLILFNYGRLLDQTEYLAEKEHSTKEVIGRSNWLGVILAMACLGRMTYLSTSDRDALRLYQYCQEYVPAVENDLVKILSETPRQAANIKECRVLVDRMMSILKQLPDKLNGDSVQSISDIKEVWREVIQLRHEILALEKSRYPVTSESLPQVRKKQRDFITLAFILEVGLALVLFFAYTRNITRRLGILADNVHRFTKREKLHAPLSGKDEIVSLDRAFHDMSDALLVAEQHKQEFLHMISHDMRTPLTALAVSMRLIRTGRYGTLSETGETLLEKTDRNLDRLVTMIGELLDIERMEAGISVIVCRNVELSDIIQRAVEAVRPLADEQRIKLVAPQCDARIYADDKRIVQVIVNLLGNALNYSPPEGSISIDVADSADWLEVRISDQGPGIPPEHVDKIFERFQQVPGTPSARASGSGLGLAICKAIIEAHKGQIGMISQVGEGSTAWFRIPKNVPQRD